MNYIRQLNAFEKWLGENNLSNSAELLMRKIFGIGNRKGWPEWVVIENLELMAVMRTERKATVIAWRDELVESGLLKYRKGKKKSPNRYKITLLYELNGTVNDDSSVPQVVPKSVPQVVPKSVPQVVPCSKHKQKLKEPPTPLPEIPGDFPETIQAALCDWLQYKAERKETYKPMGLTQFFSLVRGKIQSNGEYPVSYAIRTSMANNWQGVVWDKMKEAPEQRRRL